MSAPLRLLFVCVENSCRSQMAEAFARRAGHEAFSAGSQPSGVVNPKAIASMAAIDIDMTGHTSEGLDALPDLPFDAAVTMGCGDACPAVRAGVVEDWEIPDPKHMEPDDFARVRDQIASSVLDLIQRMSRRPAET